MIAAVTVVNVVDIVAVVAVVTVVAVVVSIVSVFVSVFLAGDLIVINITFTLKLKKRA